MVPKKIQEVEMKKITLIVLCLALAGFVYASGGGESPAASSGPTGEVNMFAWLPDNPDIVVNWVNAFEKKYPGVKVNAQMMTGNTLIENMQPRFASGNMPDVFSNELAAVYKSWVDAGAVADLGDTKAWHDMVPAMQQVWTHNGVRYGIAGGVCTTLIFYNKDYFKQAGIASVPEDWQQFLNVCEKLKSAGITPLVWYGGFPNMLSNGPLSWGVANYVFPNEPDFVKNLEETKYDFSKNPGWLKTYERMDLLNKKGYFMDGFISTDYGQGQEFFNNGDAAMFFAGTWQAAYVIDQGDFDTGLFLPPWNDPGQELVTLNASETGWSVGKNDNEKLGKLLLDFMFHERWDIYQNPRGCVTPFKEDKNDQLNPKLAEAMAELNKYPEFVDLFGRVLPSPVHTEGMTLGQSIYVDKTPKDVIPLLTKVQNEYFATK
jgi:multiple sugar transport system substrate-binding protein/raffinose/stachyose/melibiose transport system substrate-binding protein